MSDFFMNHIQNASIQRIDTVGNDTYVGVARPGTDEAAALWSIEKITKTNPITTRLCEGTSDFDKVWENRLLYSYS